MRVLLTEMNSTANRAELDKKTTPWDKFFTRHAAIYQDASWVAAALLPACVKGNAHFQENKLDPDDKKILNVSQEKLEEHFREKCAKFTQAYVNWSRSGHNDDDNFFDFCDGYKSTLLTFLMIQLELTELAPFFSAALRADITLDTHPTDDKMLSWSSSPSVNAPGGRTGGSEV